MTQCAIRQPLPYDAFMSLLVFLIAAVPAAAVVLVAEKTRSKAAIIAAASVAVAVGVLTGNPAYVGVDLVCVGVALLISWQIAKTPIDRTPEEIERRRLARIKAEEDQANWDKAFNTFISNALIIGAVVLLLAFKFWQPSSPSTAQPQPATQPPTPAVALPARPPSHQLKPATKPDSAPSKPRTVTQCLKIADEQAMVRCLKKAP